MTSTYTQKGWRERFDDTFASVHNIYSWRTEECSCDDNFIDCGEQIKGFIEAELATRAQAFKEKVREGNDDWEAAIKYNVDEATFERIKAAMEALAAKRSLLA